MTNPSPPSVGRIIHVRTNDGACLAGIVTEGQGHNVRATIFPPGHIPLATDWLLHDETARDEGTWHWPERVEVVVGDPAVTAIPRPVRSPDSSLGGAS